MLALVLVALLVPAVLVSVWSESPLLAFLVPNFAIWLGGVAEAVATPGAGVAEKAKGAGKATGAALLGFAGVLVLVAVLGAI